MSKETRLLEWEGEGLSCEAATLILAGLKDQIERDGHPRRLFRIAVEMVQNVRLHSIGPAQILILQHTGSYTVRTENLSDPDAAIRLLEHANWINAMPEEEVTAAIQKRRQAHLPPGSRGAGIGLLEIRRLSASNWACKVIPGPDQYRLVLSATLTHNSAL